MSTFKRESGKRMQNFYKQISGTFINKNYKKVYQWQNPFLFYFSTSVDTNKSEGYEEEYDEHGFRIIKSRKTKIRDISLDESLRYVVSQAYFDTYGDAPVWKNYRRNYYGQRPPKVARKTCIKGDTIISASPCPICRDQYLVVDYRNVNLLNQFICPYTRELLSVLITGLCQHKYFGLQVQVAKSFDYDLKLPYVKYSYEDYFPKHYGKDYNLSLQYNTINL